MTRPVEAAAPRAIAALRAAARPLDNLDPLMERIGEARFVLLGEATHGTHEFYRERARITRRLVEEKGFRAVAIEGDWPDAYRINRYIRGLRGDDTPEQALGDFRRFPRWMWRNTDVVALLAWLHEHNAWREPRERVGFYGLDLYSLYASMEAVLRYLDAVDPDAASRARERYACFDRYRDDAQRYGLATAFGARPDCEDEVLGQLRELLRSSAARASRDGRWTPDDHFHAEQNARLVKNAEAYYRSMFRGRVLSWNLRDRHMMETLAALATHLEKTGPVPVKIVVWAHNSHLGDARATELGAEGEWNLGQLVRERFERECVLVGFTTHHGTVTAARAWDAPAMRRNVRPALAGSYESLLHATELGDFMVLLGSQGPHLPEPLLERAIGVVYLPHSERQSHYFEARLGRQFDALLHFDESHAVEPLDHSPGWHAGEPPETWPTGL